MEFVNSSTGVVVTEDNFRAMNPLTSFPAIISQADLNPYGLSIVQPIPQPVVGAYYSLVEGVPVQITEGVWQQTWVTTPIALAQAQASQSAIVASECGQAILDGFTSSALGAVHTYPSSLIDQQNLMTAVTLSVLPSSTAPTSVWCQDSNGNWAFVSHTVAQIQQLGIDWKANLDSLRSKNAQLQAQITAVTSTVDAVAAIVWSTTGA